MLEFSNYIADKGTTNLLQKHHVENLFGFSNENNKHLVHIRTKPIFLTKKPYFAKKIFPLKKGSSKICIFKNLYAIFISQIYSYLL